MSPSFYSPPVNINVANPIFSENRAITKHEHTKVKNQFI